MKIVETLEYGNSLLDNGNVLTNKGEIITMDDYTKRAENIANNAPDWQDIPADELEDILKVCMWSAITYDNLEEDKGQMSIAGLDNDGEPFYLRVQRSFGGAETYQFAKTEYSKLVYQVRRNRADLLEELSDILQDLFGTLDQIGTLFSPDSETSYLSKTFIRDGHVWKISWKNNQLNNVKKTMPIHASKDVGESASSLKNSIAARLATGGFANLR